LKVVEKTPAGEKLTMKQCGDADQMDIRLKFLNIRKNLYAYNSKWYGVAGSPCWGKVRSSVAKGKGGGKQIQQKLLHGE
jgi:hypothetical protein